MVQGPQADIVVVAGACHLRTFLVVGSTLHFGAPWKTDSNAGDLSGNLLIVLSLAWYWHQPLHRDGNHYPYEYLSWLTQCIVLHMCHPSCGRKVVRGPMAFVAAHRLLAAVQAW